MAIGKLAIGRFDQELYFARWRRAIWIRWSRRQTAQSCALLSVGLRLNACVCERLEVRADKEAERDRTQVEADHDIRLLVLVAAAAAARESERPKELEAAHESGQ